jgi:hypothetical protein
VLWRWLFRVVAPKKRTPDPERGIRLSTSRNPVKGCTASGEGVRGIWSTTARHPVKDRAASGEGSRGGWRVSG